jgi:hypothetical protein
MGPSEVQAGRISGAEETQAAPAPLEVIVLFTDIASTLCALRTAGELAQGLAGRIRLLGLQRVPYPLPLEEPPVALPFLDRCFRRLFGSCLEEAGGHGVDMIADIRLCRDAWETLRTGLAPHSVVVIGKRTRWWPEPEDRLARKLRAAGHHVVRTSAHKGLTHA